MTELETRIRVTVDNSELSSLEDFEFIDQSDVDEACKEIDDLAQKAVPNLGNSLEDWIRFEIGTQQLIDTGNMLGSVYSYQMDDLTVYVDVAATNEGYSYPEGIEYGTGVYGPTGKKIEGNPFLYWPGADHPVRSVKGIKPTPFVEPARETFITKIEEEFQ